MKLRVFIFILLSFYLSGSLYGKKTDKKFTITGKVVDVNEHPVSGAIILIDGKKTTSTTNEKGYYKVRVKPSAEKIEIFLSSIGLREELINGRKSINFSFDRIMMDQTAHQGSGDSEEVVDVGYDSEKKKDRVYQVNRIDGNRNEFSSYTTIYDMIKGRIPGVSVTGNTIMIQGPISFTTSSTPLFVVDGIVVSSIDNISPIEVSSIDILKGPAAAIYGSRGANGVILIKLKGPIK